jgi:hypothetical protein
VYRLLPSAVRQWLAKALWRSLTQTARKTARKAARKKPRPPGGGHGGRA